MSRNDTSLPALVWGRRRSDHFQGQERRRTLPAPLGQVRQDTALIAQVIATHIGVEQTRQKRRAAPHNALAAYRTVAQCGQKAPKNAFNCAL